MDQTGINLVKHRLQSKSISWDEQTTQACGIAWVQRREDSHSGLAIDTANVSLSGDGKDNFLHASIVTA
jgi:hypothetical protein